MVYVASLSGGKDSVAMILRIMELEMPLNYCVFFDTGMEFKAVYKMIEQLRKEIEAYGAELVILKPENDWLYDMLLRPIKFRDGSGVHYGAEWCGATCRWRTSDKVNAINRFLSGLTADKSEIVQYIGIAYDEQSRLKYVNGKTYPLYDWGWTERKCLSYCYSKGYDWYEENDGVRLYDILDRIGCFCCSNKNLNELRNIWHYLPSYWNMLKALQERIDRPFKSNGMTIHDFEKRFEEERLFDQVNLFDLLAD